MTSIPDSHKDLLDAKFATFATIGADGTPQLSEVWFLAEGDEIALSFTTGRQKTKNLEERPGVNLFILDPTNPFRYLEIRGQASVVPDADYVFGDKVGAKYETDIRNFDQPGDVRVKVILTPTKVNAIAMG